MTKQQRIRYGKEHSGSKREQKRRNTSNSKMALYVGLIFIGAVLLVVYQQEIIGWVTMMLGGGAVATKGATGKNYNTGTANTNSHPAYQSDKSNQMFSQRPQDLSRYSMPTNFTTMGQIQAERESYQQALWDSKSHRTQAYASQYVHENMRQWDARAQSKYPWMRG